MTLRREWEILGPKLWWMSTIHGFTSAFSPWPWPSSAAIEAQKRWRIEQLSLEDDLRAFAAGEWP